MACWTACWSGHRSRGGRVGLLDALRDRLGPTALARIPNLLGVRRRVGGEAALADLFGAVRFEPGIPMWLVSHPQLPDAAPDDGELGPFADAAEARHAAAKHYACAKDGWPGRPGNSVRLQHVT